MTTPEGQRAGETMEFGEWEPVLRDDPRGQPVPYYRGLVCLVAHGENIISVVTKDGSSIPSECWDDVAKLVASAPTLATENARLTERVKVLEAALTFSAEPVPPVQPGHMGCFLTHTRSKTGYETVIPAYYLNAYPLQYDDDCKERGCTEEHEDGCPTTGWFYDESNFEYDNCYHPLQAEVLAWSKLPTPEFARTTLTHGEGK